MMNVEEGHVTIFSLELDLGLIVTITPSHLL